MPQSLVLSKFIFLSEQDTRELPEVSQDEYGEEDHGPAPAGRVQPPGQRAGPDASAAPLHGALSSSTAHDPERAGRKTLHDVTGVQQGKPGNLQEVFSLFELSARILYSQDHLVLAQQIFSHWHPFIFPFFSHSVALGDKLTFGDSLFLSLFLKCNPQMRIG